MKKLKKFLGIILCLGFGGIGLITTVIMLDEPYYFDQMKQALSNMLWRIQTHSSSGGASVQEMEAMGMGREKVSFASGVQRYAIPNLKKPAGMGGKSMMHYRINVKDLGERQLIISHQIQTGAIHVMGYLPKFAGYSSPLALPHIADINFVHEDKVSCFALSIYNQKSISPCYPITLFRGPETVYLDEVIVGIYAENASELEFSLSDAKFR